MNEELKPCPFCGKVPENKKSLIPFDTGRSTTITYCKCGTFLNCRRWNIRPIEDKLKTEKIILEKENKIFLDVIGEISQAIRFSEDARGTIQEIEEIFRKYTKEYHVQFDEAGDQ